MMNAAAQNPNIKGYVWDTPLLFETELNKLCDAVVFVDTPVELRLKRVHVRGWDADELARRENSQMPLDKKARISDYSIANSADAEEASSVQMVRSQVREVLSRILERVATD
jgi:dephospho-CoA kinase